MVGASPILTIEAIAKDPNVAQEAALRMAEAFTEDIGDDNFAAVYVPGNLAHGFEALTDVLMLYHVTEEYDPSNPDEHGVPWNDPRVVDLWSTRSPLLSQRDTAAAS